MDELKKIYTQFLDFTKYKINNDDEFFINYIKSIKYDKINNKQTNIPINKKLYEQKLNNLKWSNIKYNESAIISLYKIFGPPEIFEPGKNGYAIWTQKTLKKKGHIWNRVEIHDVTDEKFEYDIDNIHIHLWYKMNINNNIIPNIKNTNKQIIFNDIDMGLIKVKSYNLNRCSFVFYALLLLNKYIINNKNDEKKKLYKNINKPYIIGLPKYNSNIKNILKLINKKN